MKRREMVQHIKKLINKYAGYPDAASEKIMRFIEFRGTESWGIQTENKHVWTAICPDGSLVIVHHAIQPIYVSVYKTEEK